MSALIGAAVFGLLPSPAKAVPDLWQTSGNHDQFPACRSPSLFMVQETKELRQPYAKLDAWGLGRLLGPHRPAAERPATAYP